MTGIKVYRLRFWKFIAKGLEFANLGAECRKRNVVSKVEGIGFRV